MKNVNLHVLARALHFRQWTVEPTLFATLYTMHSFWQYGQDSSKCYGRQYPEKLIFQTAPTFCFTCKKFVGMEQHGLIFACSDCLGKLKSATDRPDVSLQRKLGIYAEFVETLAALVPARQQEFWAIVRKYYGNKQEESWLRDMELL